MPKPQRRRSANLDRPEQIKRLVIIAMFSDDELMDRLVLKGGNALDIVYQISTRSSFDVDFSLEGDWRPEELEEVRRRIERGLQRTFQEAGYVVFDVHTVERPPSVTPDLATFWGGYLVEFKLLEQDVYAAHAGSPEALRRRAGAKFSIDISRFEYTRGKQARDLDGYRIFVYSAEMMVCEKLRAICQQMPEYGPVVQRSRPGKARARDFVDIHGLITHQRIEMTSAANRQLLRAFFQAKHVPLALLGLIQNYREFHRPDFAAVQQTVKASVQLRDFDFYFDFVLDLVARLEPLGDKQPP